MKIFRGKVISTKMEKTAVVAVERVVSPPLYKKKLRRVKKFYVHSETPLKLGDEVQFVCSRPYSKLKRWRLVAVVNGQKKMRRKGK